MIVQDRILRRGLAACCLLAFIGLPAAPAAAQVRIQGEAIRGEPFGVGRLLMDLPREDEPDVLGVAGVGVTEKSGRVLYPAADQRPFRALIRDLVGASGERAAVYFLFRGAEPLELTVRTRSAHAVRVTPRDDPRGLARMLGAWWQAYAPPPRLLEDKPEFPPVVQGYLQAMLARRLSLPPPARREPATWQEQMGQDLGVFLGFEPIRLAMQEDRMLGRAAGLAERADQPLPRAIDPPPLAVPDLPEKIDVEPLAARVPEECLYIRFGSVANFLWFRDQLERASGDFGNLVSARGLDYEILRRNEDQLCLRQTAVSKALGSAVSGLVGGAAVSDVALVGMDMFQREGAAFGVLFQARTGDFLAKEIRRQRTEALKAGQGKVKEETVEIEGQKVSYLSSPGNRIRSFYATDGNFHLVTSSKALARRFLQTRSGEGTLAKAADFRFARSQFPAGRGDTAFIYLSDAFFRNVTGPRYRVEMTRRLEALTDVTLVQLAVLTAAAEGKPGGSVEQLVAGGFLPQEFGPRPDGSRAVYAGGTASDSLRGERGFLLPVPDVEVTAVMPSEARMYSRFGEHYRAEWGRVDPMTVAIRRQSVGEGRERITIDARVSPLSSQAYDLLSRLVGPPDKKRLAPVEGDVAFGEVILRNQRLFAGIRDIDPPDLRIGRGRLAVAGAPPIADLLLKPLMVGYLGTHGDPGLLGLLGVLVPARMDAGGFSGMPGGLWRRQFDRFTAYSFQHDVLAAVTPQLRFEEIDRPAQVHVRIADPTQTRLAGWLNGLGYGRTRDTCLGNLRLLSDLEQQLHVPGDGCRDAAELLLGAKLVCPLRGKYVYHEAPGGLKRWTSTALDAGGGRVRAADNVPQGFLAPPLDWLRGLSAVAQISPREANLHAEVLMLTAPSGSPGP